MEERPFTHASFELFRNEGRLMGSRCTSCGAVYLPPRELCPRCFSTKMTWLAFSGEGTLSGFTCIHVGLPEMTAEGYSRQRPYYSGVVRLAEGPSISGQIVGVDAAHPETIRVGMPVRMVVVPPEAVTAPSGGGATIANRLVFEPAEG